ncbi:MAG: YcxB family protein [Opitutales bacterium]
MTFRYSIELADQLAFTRYHLAHSDRVRKQKRKALVIALSFLAVLTVGFAFLPGYWAWLASLPFCLGILYVVAYPAAYERLILTKTEQLAEKDTSGRFGREQQLTILSEGLALDTPEGTQGLRWEQIREVIIEREHIFIYFSEINALIIPEERIKGASFEQVAATIQDYASGQGPDRQTVTFG